MFRNYCRYVKREVKNASVTYERNRFFQKNSASKSFYKYIDQSTKKKIPVSTLKWM